MSGTVTGSMVGGRPWYILPTDQAVLECELVPQLSIAIKWWSFPSGVNWS